MFRAKWSWVLVWYLALVRVEGIQILASFDNIVRDAFTGRSTTQNNFLRRSSRHFASSTILCEWVVGV